ncbi:MAG: hypothetical protein V4601_08205 [Pseudomonadota bacterium]
MKHAALFLALMLAAPAASQTQAVKAPADPAAAANAFYAVYGPQVGKGGGIPDAATRLRFSAVLSPRLNKQLADAAAAQARLTAKVKNAVPPMLEGDVFSSLFEGATAWKVGACQSDGSNARCPVALTHVSPPIAGRAPVKPAQWNDTVLLTNGPGGWKVDDVIYDASFAFGNTGRLSAMLRMVIAATP